MPVTKIICHMMCTSVMIPDYHATLSKEKVARRADIHEQGNVFLDEI